MIPPSCRPRHVHPLLQLLPDFVRKRHVLAPCARAARADPLRASSARSVAAHVPAARAKTTYLGLQIYSGSKRVRPLSFHLCWAADVPPSGCRFTPAASARTSGAYTSGQAFPTSTWWCAAAAYSCSHCCAVEPRRCNADASAGWWKVAGTEGCSGRVSSCSCLNFTTLVASPTWSSSTAVLGRHAVEHQGRGGAGGGGDLRTPGPHKCGVGERLEQLCGEAHAGVRTAEAARTGVTPALQLRASLCVTVCYYQLVASSAAGSRWITAYRLCSGARQWCTVVVVAAAAARKLRQSCAAMPADPHCSF